MKAWGYVALVVAVIALLGGTYWLGHSRTPPVIEQTINEFTVLDSIPASVQTVHIVAPSGEVVQAEYATMDTTLCRQAETLRWTWRSAITKGQTCST